MTKAARPDLSRLLIEIRQLHFQAREVGFLIRW